VWVVWLFSFLIGKDSFLWLLLGFRLGHPFSYLLFQPNHNPTYKAKSQRTKEYSPNKLSHRISQSTPIEHPYQESSGQRHPTPYHN